MSGADLLNFSFSDDEARVSDKSPTALRTISEVSELLDVPQHVLRFWETKFAQIKPLKRNGGRRFYRPDDIEVLQQVKFLLYKQGYTIKGAKKAIEDYAKVLSSTMVDVGRPSMEGAMPPANVNDNADVAEDEAAPLGSTGHTIDAALSQASLAALRADLIEARNALAVRLGAGVI